MPFLIVMPFRPGADYYVSLDQAYAWLISGGATFGTANWQSSGSFALVVPDASAGQGYNDASGRFWLYGALELYSGFVLTGVWGATYDFGSQVAVPQWTVASGPTGTGGIASAVSDGLGGNGFYAVVAEGNSNWIVHYTGTGITAASTTTSDTTWVHAWDIGTPPTLPFYNHCFPWAIWKQGGSYYVMVMGSYYGVNFSGGLDTINSIWVSSGDPTDATGWTFVRYLNHQDLSGPGGSFTWGNYLEDRLPWRQPIALGTDVFLTTGMNIVHDSSVPPDYPTVVWRMDSGGTVHSDLQMAIPSSGSGLENWGGPLAIYHDPVYGDELYWAQFTNPSPFTWSSDSGTFTLWRRRSGTWSSISTHTVSLYHNIYSPIIATMIGTDTGLWLLASPNDTYFGAGRDIHPTIRAWDAASNTWSDGASIGAPTVPEYTPRIWRAR